MESDYPGHHVKMIMAGATYTIFFFFFSFFNIITSFSFYSHPQMGAGGRPHSHSPHLKQLLFLLIIGCFLEFTGFFFWKSSTFILDILYQCSVPKLVVVVVVVV